TPPRPSSRTGPMLSARGLSWAEARIFNSRASSAESGTGMAQAIARQAADTRRQRDMVDLRGTARHGRNRTRIWPAEARSIPAVTGPLPEVLFGWRLSRREFGPAIPSPATGRGRLSRSGSLGLDGAAVPGDLAPGQRLRQFFDALPRYLRLGEFQFDHLVQTGEVRQPRVAHLRAVQP